jgi:hypothetical protein
MLASREPQVREGLRLGLKRAGGILGCGVPPHLKIKQATASDSRLKRD